MIPKRNLSKNLPPVQEKCEKNDGTVNYSIYSQWISSDTLILPFISFRNETYVFIQQMQSYAPGVIHIIMMQRTWNKR